jgi:hypothetical protein
MARTRPIRPVGRFTAQALGRGQFLTAKLYGLDQALIELDARNRAWDKGIQEKSKAAAVYLQARLQSAAAAEYRRAATGRFARGIRVRVIQKRSSGTQLGSALLQVYALQYRETQFLTNLGEGGYFDAPNPVLEYPIFAKKGTRVINGTVVQNRLRVPRRGLIAEFPDNDKRKKEVLYTIFGDPHERSRGGGAHSGALTFASGMTGRRGRQHGVVPRNMVYFYPLHVNHPGFERDVVKEVVEDEAGKLRNELISGTVAIWTKTSRGIELRPASVEATGTPPPSGPGRL